MKNEYIATFYSHFGAMRFKKECDASDDVAKMGPVPRDLSSSCGTCVRFRSEAAEGRTYNGEEIEQVVRVERPGVYIEIYHS